ncbi:Protein prenyltransferase [Penicillium daleae]|uniref:Protein prenyltransferase n=1 Tax=Penicillium daleae TaxID=63821 RepID=A0AAD6FZE3_9EURO|nr:Protein prenyltransferase [Penicillium daleae]KAJ5438492.1 Protein prenyltransferase [Penicillium daleae]
MTIPDDAFQQLASVFASRGNEILEIEIIPPSPGSPFLQDGCSIGITKKLLVQAYTVARKLFFKRLMPMTGDDLFANLPNNSQSHGIISDLVTTEIMLLFDCEHLTACNWRKRRLVAALARRHDAPDRRSQLIQILKTELTLLQSYQCSPLHRHTKSPTLWSHRLWVLKQLLKLEDQSPETLLALERAELAVVLRAAELHPKNYYAFTYMRQLHALLAMIPVETKDPSSLAVLFANKLVDPVLDWCLANPRDISGWSFGIYLLSHVPERQLQVDAVGRVLRFARDVGWEGESLWTFVDQAVRQFDLESVVEDTILYDKEGHEPVPTVAEPSSTKWPWRARLARARAYWAVYGSSHDL